ncbi:MAG: hypothetical protein UV68_C0024G0008 [Candidatus Collierbacteria bacterium GW2011_GWC2_43_12]|uniref:Uncharacterized protein n=1 Tax=Candidatus Collierbacteria bacterium GW2011_GWC2_43_12 TaxID=1618390 RepID=A0A0G1FDM0_9BACT|nr:MAG: hypothetical protein UV68_C0024G0008 [Candidatus Collierbacteria bacterium GW2011_GWC2_43_12]
MLDQLAVEQDVSHEELTYQNLKGKYLLGEWREYAQKDNHLAISLFLVENQRAGTTKDFIMKGGILLMELESEDGVINRQVPEWFVTLKEYVDQGGVVDKEIEMIARLLVDRKLAGLRLTEEKGHFMKMSSDINALIPLVECQPMRSLAVSSIVEITSGRNVSNRRHGYVCLGFLKDSDAVIEILKASFARMDTNESIDIVDSLSQREGFVDMIQVISRNLSLASDTMVKSFWNSIKEYCDRRMVDGFSDDLRLFFRDEIMEADEDLASTLPSNLVDWLMDERETNVEIDSRELLWEVIVEGTNIQQTADKIKDMKYVDRLIYLSDMMPGEEFVVVRFISSLFNNGYPYSEETALEMNDFSEFREEFLRTPILRKIWKIIKDNPDRLLFQLAQWLAQFPVRELDGLGVETLDLVEGVTLSGSESSLCGWADIYMEESLNMDRIETLFGGRLLQKGLGNEAAALCVKDFRVTDPKGGNMVFKRGCYYVVDNIGRWKYVRNVGGDEIPRAAKDLITLADKWVAGRVRIE